ncbi:hypothetical protein J056_001941 [Wallemia ichthyophaga EXF-994]|uniref:Chromatin target of PRMT1 protein C-terminal domain-containing protein n=1 Tax=Wallemia ichthyophaga (strain EXF-994 / CBS 113033) TaxID=1299270 RepID=R9AH70_WALI9|nr:uncharacterized protein J056_001941 [Wallemia ichthyophaga EXF-994]EOQ99385.1 hypothetical protein J056_001941 [Wallemia ichthyophaga EXF-994]
MSNDDNKYKNKLLSRIQFGGRVYKLQDADLDNIQSFDRDKDRDIDTDSLQVDEQTRERRANKFGAVEMDRDDTKTEQAGKLEHPEQLDDSHDTHDPDARPDATVRPYSLFLSGDIVGKLSTQQLLAYATEFCEPPPYGMEWIDDHRCVFLWHESHDFRQAWKGLLLDPPERGLPRHGQDDFFNLLPARNVPSTLSRIDPIDDAVQIRIRPATTGDVKKKTQYRNSRWYDNHGRRAGKIGESPPRVDSSRREMSPERWENDKADLDAELDGISTGRYRDYSPPRSKSSRSRGGARGRDRGRSGRDREARRPLANADDLDKELEDYVSNR